MQSLFSLVLPVHVIQAQKEPVLALSSPEFGMPPSELPRLLERDISIAVFCSLQ